MGERRITLNMTFEQMKEVFPEAERDEEGTIWIFGMDRETTEDEQVEAFRRAIDNRESAARWLEEYRRQND